MEHNEGQLGELFLTDDLLPKELEEKVDKQVKEMLGYDGYIGYCHDFWSAKKQILREEYGIDWKTPAERYPTIIFD